MIGVPMLNERLEKIISKLALSKDEFAKKCGISKSQLYNYLNGINEPTAKFFRQLKTIFPLVNIDWIVSGNQVIDIIEANKKTENPNIIFVYDFTQKGLDRAEGMFQKILTNKNHIIVDASGLTSYGQLLKEILGKEKETGRDTNFKLHHDLIDLMLNNDVILIIKNMSLSKITRSGDCIRSIFKIMDDAWDMKNIKKAGIMCHLMPKSSLIILDFPSYLEKNANIFGDYAIAIPAKELSVEDID